MSEWGRKEGRKEGQTDNRRGLKKKQITCENKTLIPDFSPVTTEARTQ